MTMTELDDTMLAEATQRVAQMNLPANAEPSKPRATRSDKGKPRLYVEMPGVRLDMAHPEARDVLRSLIAVEAPRGNSAERIWDAFEQLLSHIDRLSEKRQD
jgi:hypothetical protein